jgi:hypothetical protein
MRLLSRRTEDYLKGPSDVGGDNHEIFDETGILQFADIPLDNQSLKP